MIVEFNTGNRLGYDWNNSFTGYKFISKKEWDNWPPAATCYEIKTRKVFKSDLYCGVSISVNLQIFFEIVNKTLCYYVIVIEFLIKYNAVIEKLTTLKSTNLHNTIFQ